MNSRLGFSIIIPTWNRWSKLRTCIEVLDQLDYPKSHYEVIVVDDGSEPEIDPCQVLAGINCKIRVVRQEHSGPATARNLGATVAVKQYLAFTDDDCRPQKNWLRVLEDELSKAPGSAVCGRTVNGLGRQFWAEASQVLLDYLFENFNYNSRQAGFFISNNLVIPASDFSEIGGFDVRFPLAAAEDRELCDRWLRLGLALAYVKEAVVEHFHDLSLGGFLRQHFNYGRGAWIYHQIRVKDTPQMPAPESRRFYSRLLRFPFERFKPIKSALLGGALILSQIANTAGFLRQAASSKTKET